MILKLIDYKRDVTEHDIGDLKDIAVITIEVITGDEIANVVYKDYTTRRFASSHDRMNDYYDGKYEIYRYDKEDCVINKKEFKNRKSSYDFWYWDWA